MTNPIANPFAQTVAPAPAVAQNANPFAQAAVQAVAQAAPMQPPVAAPAVAVQNPVAQVAQVAPPVVQNPVVPPVVAPPVAAPDMMSLADVAGCDFDSIDENSFDELAVGKYDFRVTKAELLERGDYIVASVTCQPVQVIALVDPTAVVADQLAMSHDECVFSLEQVAKKKQLKRLMKAVGYLPSVAGMSMGEQLAELSASQLAFSGAIKHTKSKDGEKTYVNLDIKTIRAI